MSSPLGGLSAHLDPVVRESTPTLIARSLRTAIAEGELPPGTQLGEAALARELGVSRGPLREAMQRLSQEGLLVGRRNRGLAVVDLTPESIEDMYLLREALETAAVRTILRRGGAEAAGARLDEAVDGMTRFADRPDGPEMTAADLDFHRALVGHAHSEHLSRILKSVMVETSMCLHAMSTTYTSADERIEEHRAIARAVSAGDEQEALRLLHDHMTDGYQRIVADRPG